MAEGYQPRIRGADLQQYLNQTVSLLGQVVRSDSDNAAIRAADGTEISVSYAVGGAPMPVDAWVNVIGRAESASSVSEFKHIQLSNAVDMDSYSKLCELANGEFRSLFHP